MSKRYVSRIEALELLTNPQDLIGLWTPERDKDGVPTGYTVPGGTTRLARMARETEAEFADRVALHLGVCRLIAVCEADCAVL